MAIPLLAASSAAFAQPPAVAVAGAADRKEASALQDRSGAGAVEGLPFAQGRAFGSLDEYLAFLRSRGTYDVPWYREIRPGAYELVSRRGPGAEPEIFTREELERKFGFAD